MTARGNVPGVLSKMPVKIGLREEMIMGKNKRQKSQIPLNKEQEEAANSVFGVAAVIAVPGSGKTLTMTRRIGNLVQLHNVPPEKILGLTFTRNAAEAMRNRLVPVLEDLAQRVTLTTIHSFCHFLLRTEGRTFEILTGKNQIIFIREVMKRLRVKDLSVGMVLREISLAKNNLIPVEEFREIYIGDRTMLTVTDIYQAYDEEKSRKLLLDFDDLLVEAYHLLKDNEAIREKYRETYRHLLIDEFQDSNYVQLELLKILVTPDEDGSFWICGDDWQSIYAFTGASIGNILNFKEIFPGSKEFILNLNYRSTPQIIQACQNLIQWNIRKIHKELKTTNPDGEAVIVLESSSEEGEALNLVNEITDLVSCRGFAHRDITVLYRANFQSRIVEESFCQHKIPYHIENGLNFYQRHEVKVLLDYLRVIHDPNSEAGDEALKSIINIPNRYIGRKFTAELEDYASGQGKHLYEALKSMRVDVPYLRKNIKDFTRLMNPLIEDAQNLQPADVIHLLRNALDYDRFITEDDIPSPDDVKIQNLDQLQLSATKFKDIGNFLTYTDSFQDEAAHSKDGIALMTIHKSKGLEFPVVFVIGLVEGITPTKKGDIEEERRIVFVAISRAMQILYLSYSHTFLGVAVKRSIFIDEILGTKTESVN
jgi:DNA helicase-2/ATP-dependent DNA helicase PcrA